MAWKKHLPLTLDVAAVGLLFALGLVVLLGQAGGDGLPFWATSNDLLMEGPDAGEWAINALRVSWGAYESVDVHRPPVWLMATAAALNWTPDVAMAGHWVNHMAFLALPLVAYGLGRADAGPASGLAAGCFALCCSPLILASRRYGVDPLITVILPLSVLCALPLRRWWFLAPLSGMVAGLATASHFTALPFVLPAALVILVRGPTKRWWNRLAALALYVLGVALVLWLIDRTFSSIDFDNLKRSVSEGIDPQLQEIGNREAELTDDAASRFDTDWGLAAKASIRNGLQRHWYTGIPWVLMLALPWLGVLGAGLGVAKGSGRWRFFRWQDAGYGVALLCCLAPLPVFIATDAEPRYSLNLLGFVAVLCGRGLCSIPGLVELGLREKWSWFPRGVLALPLVAWIAVLGWRSSAQMRLPTKPADVYAVAARDLGVLLAGEFPGGGGAAVPIREAVAYAGREYCPLSNCPFGATETYYRQCVEVIRAQCAGSGPIPYVVVRDGPLGMGDDARFQTMGDWVVDNYGTIAVLESERFTAEVVALPREAALTEQPTKNEQELPQ